MTTFSDYALEKLVDLYKNYSHEVGSSVGWAKCRPRALIWVRNSHGILPTTNGAQRKRWWATLRFCIPYLAGWTSCVSPTYTN